MRRGVASNEHYERGKNMTLSVKTERDSSLGGSIYREYFDNGYGISVLVGNGVYVHGTEVAILHGSRKVIDATSHSLCYATPITDDVVPVANEDFSEVRAKVMELSPNDLCNHNR